MITESGGFQVPTADGPRLPVMVEEKGTFWSKITVHGTPGHASQPYRTDNALVTAAEVVRRIAEYRPEAQHRRHVAALRRGARTARRSCADPDRLRRARSTELPLGLARIAHSCTHTTMAPTVAHGGTKTNIIPDRVRPPGRHPHAARARSGEAARRAADGRDRRPRRQGRDHVERRPRDRVADRHAAVGLARRA